MFVHPFRYQLACLRGNGLFHFQMVMVAALALWGARTAVQVHSVMIDFFVPVLSALGFAAGWASAVSRQGATHDPWVGYVLSRPISRASAYWARMAAVVVIAAVLALLFPLADMGTSSAALYRAGWTASGALLGGAMRAAVSVSIRPRVHAVLRYGVIALWVLGAVLLLAEYVSLFASILRVAKTPRFRSVLWMPEPGWLLLCQAALVPFALLLARARWLHGDPRTP